MSAKVLTTLLLHFNSLVSGFFLFAFPFIEMNRVILFSYSSFIGGNSAFDSSFDSPILPFMDNQIYAEDTIKVYEE